MGCGDELNEDGWGFGSWKWDRKADFLILCAGRMSSASDKHIPAGTSRLAAFAAEFICVDTIVREV